MASSSVGSVSSSSRKRKRERELEWEEVINQLSDLDAPQNVLSTIAQLVPSPALYQLLPHKLQEILMEKCGIAGWERKMRECIEVVSYYYL